MLETWDLSSVLHMSGHPERWYIHCILRTWDSPWL